MMRVLRQWSMLYLFALTMMLPVYCLVPNQRGAITALIRDIETKKISTENAYARAAQLRLSPDQMNDKIVEQLVRTAQKQGIPDIFNAPQVQPKVTAISEAAPNPAVQKIHEDFVIFSKSVDAFKPSAAYMANTRKIGLFTDELERITATVQNLIEPLLNQKDRAIIDDLQNKLLPALEHKIEKLEQDIDEKEVARRAPQLTQTPPSNSSPAAQPTAIQTPGRDIQTVPIPIREVMSEYVNKAYTADQILAFLKKNEPGYDMEPYTFATKEELVKSIEKDPRSSWLIKKLYWDTKSIIGAYYQLQWLKLECKKFNYKHGMEETNQALVYLLSESSNDVSVVIDLFRDKTPVKNKYFIELVDEFERNNSDERLNRFERPNTRRTK